MSACVKLLKTVKIFLLLFALSLILLPVFKSPALMAGPGIAATYEVPDADATDGDALCVAMPEAGGKLARCNRAYDERTFGVLSLDPALAFRNNTTGKPVVREGRVMVNTTTLTGPIKVGDYITTSSVTGKAQKAAELLGYILGTALTPLSDGEGTKITVNGKEYSTGKIEIALAIGPLGVLPRGTFLDKIGFALVRGTQTPAAAGIFLRYVTGGLLVILVSFFAFNNFGHNITKGMESIGRNPLAKNQIQFVIIINTILIGIMVIGAILLGLVIIRL